MLIDPFLLFHYKVMAENDGQKIKRWLNFVHDEGRYNNWRGNAFEIICIYQIDALKSALGIRDVKTVEFPWESAKKADGAQIDLLIDREDGIINLCEMKFTNSPFSIDKDYEAQLLNKKEVLRQEAKLKKKTIKIVIVSVNGFKENQYSSWVTQSVDVNGLFD